MKAIKHLSAIVLTISFLAAPLAASAADEAKPKPYPLATCIVTGEKLGEMGAPFVFTHEGQEIKLCCKGCKKGFDKDPAKHLKKLENKEKKADAHEGHKHAPGDGHNH